MRRTILDENMQTYRELFATKELAKVSGPYWRCALEFYGRLNDTDRKVLLSIVRQTIDGATWLPGQKGRFVLSDGQSAVMLVAARLRRLADLFLAAEEESESSN